MSSEYEVIYEGAPAGIEDRVLQSLSSVAYECEFAPGTDLLGASTDGFLMRVKSYPSPKPRVRPDRTFLVGAEIYSSSSSAAAGQRHTIVRTSAGRSRLSGALQVLVAGALADLTGGRLVDPQEGVVVETGKALAYALVKAKSGSPPHDLREEEFVGWA